VQPKCLGMLPYLAHMTAEVNVVEEKTSCLWLLIGMSTAINGYSLAQDEQVQREKMTQKSEVRFSGA
jgi:hypothetical protein